MYKYKYIKYKKKYLNLKNQVGGDFELSETKYSDILPTELRLKQINIINKQYIAGPALYVKMTYKDKIIYFIGDLHTYAETFKCGPNDNTGTLYFPDYLHNVISNTNKVIDIFEESHYNYEKLGVSLTEKLSSGLIYNIERITFPCFYYIKQKTDCQNIYPNVRFHSIDIRHYYDKNYAETIKSEEMYEELRGANKTDFDTLLFFHDYLKSDYWNTISDKYIIKLFEKANLTDNDAIILKNRIMSSAKMFDDNNYYEFFNNLMKIIQRFIQNHPNNPDNEGLKNIISNIDDVRYQASSEIHKFNEKINEILSKLLNNYICNENGLYDYYTTKNNLFSLITTSDKIMKNMQNNFDLIKNNYDLLIMTNPKQNYLNNLIKHNRNYSGNYNIKNLKEDDNFLSYIMLYTASIMDIYALSRMLRTYEIPFHGNNFDSKNIIIIAGRDHILGYINFFKNIGGQKIFYHEGDNRCVKFEEITF
jgi:hypothetical protein